MFLPKDISGPNIQALTVALGNLVCLNVGLMFGITPQYAQLYMSEETPLNRPCSKEEASWLMALLFLGAMAGSICPGGLTRYIGPKLVLLLAGLLQIIGWFCIHFGYDILHIYSSRLFVGVSAGSAYSAMPIFIDEICQGGPNMLTLSMNLYNVFGILLGFVISRYLPYEVPVYMGLVIALAFQLLFAFVQESPYYFLRKGNMMSMEKSLRWFRGVRDIDGDDHGRVDYFLELNEWKSIGKKIAEQSTPTLRDYMRSFPVILLCLLTGLAAQLTGTYMILNYFEASYAESTEAHVMSLASMPLFGAFLVFFMGSHVKSTTMFGVTAIITGMLALCVALLHSHQDVVSPLLPFLFVVMHMFAANMTLGMPPIVISKILPKELFPNVLCFVNKCSWLLVFLLIKEFSRYSSWIKFLDCYWIFGGCCTAVGVIILCYASCVQREVKSVRHQNGTLDQWSTASSHHI